MSKFLSFTLFGLVYKKEKASDDQYHDHEDDHHDENEHHDEHGFEVDILVISIIDFAIAILCTIMVILFLKYIFKVKHSDNPFKKNDILSLSSIISYTLTIYIVIVHDILHMIELDGPFHFEFGITQWVTFFMGRILLQLSFLTKLVTVFRRSALKYHKCIPISLLILIISLFGYGVYILIIMGLNHEILSPLSHDFMTILIFVAADFATIMIITFLFLRNLYGILKRSNKRDKHNFQFLAAISKYSLLATIISIAVIIQFIALYIISISYHHEDEVNIEYLQHCISTVIIFIDTTCLYLSCKLAVKLYQKTCKYPHLCCTRLCQRWVKIKYGLGGDSIKNVEFEMTGIPSQTPRISAAAFGTYSQTPTHPTMTEATPRHNYTITEAPILESDQETQS